MALMPKRADFGDEFSDHIGLQARDPPIADDHCQSSFGHLLEGYDAGYYGCLWSRILADDMYTKFETCGPTNQVMGPLYRRTILERGGSVDGNQLVQDFLGRQPNHEAFLRALGLDVDSLP
ncbi:M3 family metallopeptidase [Streptomyces sp. NBC_01537]|uniref:M3 family metallopeptidase n=1 Tax=Streptomyces sp. NBC_01537 TaxID=2903896 RepID=UPI00386C3DEC